MRYRKERVQDLLREEISAILFQDIKDPGIGFVTIMEVKMSDDLKIARVHYSVFGNDEAKEKTFHALKRSRKYVKFLVGQRVKLKYIPDIEFIYDDRLDKMARIDELLKKDDHVGENKADN